MTKNVNVTIALGAAWKLTLSRIVYNDLDVEGRKEVVSIEAWTGLARTDKPAVTVYDEPTATTARAEVVFEPKFVREGDGWRPIRSGRTYYAKCPSSGEGGEAETALLKVVLLEDLLQNILVLCGLVLGTSFRLDHDVGQGSGDASVPPLHETAG